MSNEPWDWYKTQSNSSDPLVGLGQMRKRVDLLEKRIQTLLRELPRTTQPDILEEQRDKLLEYKDERDYLQSTINSIHGDQEQAAPAPAPSPSLEPARPRRQSQSGTGRSRSKKSKRRRSKRRSKRR